MRLQLASPDIYLSSILSIVRELTFLYICSSRSRGPAAAAGGRTSPRPPPLRQTEPRGTRNAPDKFWSAVGGFISGVGGPGQGRAAPKLERVEFPADSGPHGRVRRARAPGSRPVRPHFIHTQRQPAECHGPPRAEVKTRRRHLRKPRGSGRPVLEIVNMPVSVSPRFELDYSVHRLHQGYTGSLSALSRVQ